MLRREAARPAREPPVIAFKCPKCRVTLEFADAAAGRLARCPACRARVRVPEPPPPAEEEVVTAPVAEEPPPPRRRKKRRRPAPIPDDTPEPGETPEWLPPTVLLALGLVLAVGSPAVMKGTEGFADGLATVGLHLLVTVPLSVAGLFIAAPLLGVTFGTIGMAVLKLAAINVLTLSLAMTAMFGGMPGYVAFTLVAPVGWLLFNWLFGLEFNETMFVLTVLWLIQFLADLTFTAAKLRAGK
ncbi:MAG TPA: zf-TFIIB domain-containing protein [Gemmataceae bacterium]|jgi:hypothetical protein